MLSMDEWLVRFASDSRYPLVRDLPKILLTMDAHRRAGQHGGDWLFVNDASLQSWSTHCASGNIRTAYWRFLAEQFQALHKFVLLRSLELLQSAVAELNRRSILAPAIISRGLMELAVASIARGVPACDLIERVVCMAAESPHVTFISTDLESSLVRAICGHREGEPPAHLKQVNVLSEFANLPPDLRHSVEDIYGYLSEVCHPNWRGYERFCNESREVFPGVILTHLRLDAEAPWNADIRERTLLAVAWSALAIEWLAARAEVAAGRLLASRLCRQG